MTIIKNLINYSDKFIGEYEEWYNENYINNILFWDYINLLDFFKIKSNYKIHYLVCHQHVTIENVKTGLVKYFTGEDSYKESLKFLHNIYEKDMEMEGNVIMESYDIYPYYL